VPSVVKRWQQGMATEAETTVAIRVIEDWRHRLIDVSWFMRCLNEHLARRANAEDRCTGRFWEGRFKSQALLDEAGLLTAMAYVDLNPVRAGIAATPEESEFTSIFARIQALRPSRASETSSSTSIATTKLLAFRDQATTNAPSIPMSFCDYLELIDWSGRIVRADKRGAIDDRVPPILNRLNIDPSVWQGAMRLKGNVFGRALGQLDHLRLYAQVLGQSRVKGLMQARRLFPTT